MKSNGMQFSVVLCDGKDCSNSIVGSVSLDCELLAWDEMPQYWGGSEHFLECFESVSTLLVEVPNSVFSR